MDGVSIATHSSADYTREHRRNTVIGGAASYTASYADFITDFYRQLQKWKSETVFESNLDTITQHPSYRSIIAMGGRALPLIVDELRIAPSLLVYALEDITGERPYASDIQGDIRAMSDHWVLWSERENACSVVDRLIEVFKRGASEDECKSFESRIDHLDLRAVAADIVQHAYRAKP